MEIQNETCHHFNSIITNEQREKSTFLNVRERIHTYTHTYMLEISILIAYSQMSLIMAHAEVSGAARGLN